MPVSQKQIKANRDNAQKSTGPKTQSGKTISARNAVRHGLYSKDIIINSPYLKENNTDYNDLLNSLFDDLKPQGLFQEQLVLKIANSLWRSRRIVKAETAQINRQLDDISFHRSFKKLFGNNDNYDYIQDNSENQPNNIDDTHNDLDDTPSEKDNLVGIKSIPNDTFGRNILRYEMRLDRQLTRTLKLLKSLQQISQPESNPKASKAKKKHPPEHI